MQFKIHPFEFVGAYKLYEEERFLLADEMGMFKTAQAIFANSKFRQKKHSRLRTLVVCPTSVREHWAREVVKWAYPRGQDINIMHANTFGEGIARAKRADWTIIHYPLVSRLDEETSRKMRRLGFHHVILDEVHNAKNPFAIRTKVIKSLADRCEYLSLLSGTPIPNTITDLYTLMSLLDPKEHPLDPENLQVARQSFLQLYLDRPQAVKELLHRKMLRRLADDYIKEKIPGLCVHNVELPLTGAHLDEYCKILEENMNVGKKIMLLEQVSIDPWLVNGSLPRSRYGKDSSVKYEFLDEIVESTARKHNGKVLIFSNLKEGIIDPLLERYKKYGAIKVTGDISTEDGVREDLRLKFQHDPRVRVLLATTTMNEGVDLTAATAVVNLTVPWTPAEYYQRFKRSQRPGEVKKDCVDVYNPYTTIPGTQDSIEKASRDLLSSKERVVKYLISGIQVSLEELRELEDPSRAPRIARAIKSPSKAIFEYFLPWRGIGTQRASRKLNRSPQMSKYIAELYPSFSMAKNSADIYQPIIQELEKEGKLTPKVDLAGGPGMLSYFSGEPTIGIDISHDMLMVGKKLRGNQNKLIQASMGKLPLASQSAGLVLCSLAFQMSEPTKERASTLYETSRILKPKGYLIITLPPDYLGAHDYVILEKALNTYGFVIKSHQTNMSRSKLEIYVLQKNKEPQSTMYDLRFRGDPQNT